MTAVSVYIYLVRTPFAGLHARRRKTVTLVNVTCHIASFEVNVESETQWAQGNNGTYHAVH